LKGVKKRLFLRLAKCIGLYNAIVWQASSPLEEADIQNTVGADTCVKIARDLFTRVLQLPVESTSDKCPGAARFIFLSRIDRKKNLDCALQLLSSLEGNVTFDIYGPIGDAMYWEECEAYIRRLPPSVHAAYRGVVPHHAVAGVLARSHFSILPTRGENFGHAIVEAFLAGRPVITSDQTPWRGLAQRGAGWDLPLDDADAWRHVMQTCVDMDAATHERSSLCARSFGNEIASADTVVENRRMFRSMFQGGPGMPNGPEISVA
jgi:glycosyltransferase involved in cell wall biosynthesis